MGFVVNAVKSVVNAVVNVVTAVVRAVVNVVSSVISFIAQPFMGLLGGTPDIPNAAAESERQQGVLIQREGSTVSIPIVYGQRKVAGTVVFAETGSSDNRYLYVAYVFSEGLVEGITEVFIDDWQLSATQIPNLNSGQLITVDKDRYKDRVQLQFFPGVYFSDPRRSTLGSNVKSGIFAESTSFINTMNYNGLAVIFARYEWKKITTQAEADNNPFGGNIPKLQITLLGKRVAALVDKDNLSVLTESYEYDSAPIRYSTNPAEILLDYLRNPRYGKGLKNNDIDWDSWKTAAAKSNYEVTYIASGEKGPILTCNTVIDTGQSLMTNTKNLLMGFRAYMPYVQGKYKLRIEDAGNNGTETIPGSNIISGSATIAQTFTKDDIVGNVTYTGIDKSSKYNVVAINYVDPSQKYSVQQVIYPETEDERQTYIDIDGGRENKLDATFPTITNYAIAKDFARLLFNKSRYQETCSLTVSSKALELEPGDCIRIQSNILNFGTDPWRIVSFKVNGNMSIELGCVRNPDYIYPYVQVGAEDTVLPTFVPKGSTVYYPSVSSDIGLNPATNAIQITGFTPTALVPVTTNPNAPSGGGVGVTNNQNNTTPTSPPVGAPWGAVLTFRRSSVSDWGNGSYSFNLKFTQPSVGLYDSSTLWWRPNNLTPWQEIKLTTVPGAGGEIPATIGPVPKGNYEFYVRSYASDGRASIQILSGTVGYTNQLLSDPGFTGFLGAETKLISSGWTLPISASPNTQHNDSIDLINIRPVISGSSSRTMTVTIQQITSTINKPLNYMIYGVRLFYKLKSDTYWNYEVIRFPATYTPGQSVTQTLTGDFGTLVYPSGIVSGSVNDQLQQYEFIARLVYLDGEPAEQQLGPAVGPVERNNGTLQDFITWGTDTFASAKVSSQPIPATFNETFYTVDQNPNKTYATGLSIVGNVKALRLYNFSGQPYAYFIFNPPINSKFRGFRVRYRKITPGQNTTFITEDSPFVIAKQPNLLPGDNNEYITYSNTTLSFNDYYEFVFTGLISTPSGIVEATNSLSARIKFSVGDEASSNLYAKYDFVVGNTQEAIGALRTTFPSNPAINVKSWTKISEYARDAGSKSYWDMIKLTDGSGNATFRLNNYYQIKFQMQSTASHIVIYRRHYNSNAVNYTTANIYSGAKYNGLGPWERVRIAKASLTTDADGWYVLNLRGPIHAEYFDSGYELPATPARTLIDKRFGATGAWPSSTATPGSLANIYPFYGTGNQDIFIAVEWAQFLFVIEDSAVEGPKGMLLREFKSSKDTLGNPVTTDGFGVPGVQKQVVDDITIFNTSIASGYGRRLSEYITAPTIDKLFHTYSGDRVGSQLNSNPPTRTGYSQPYDIFLQAPLSGATVY